MDANSTTTFFLTQGVLGVTVVVLSIVVLRLYNKIEKLEQEKTALLQAWLTETKDSGKDALEVLQGNSQSIVYLAEKIESGKLYGKRKK